MENLVCTCGKKLKTTISMGETIDTTFNNVKPCTDCQDDKFEEGLQVGNEFGFESGFNIAYEEIQEEQGGKEEILLVQNLMRQFNIID